MEARQGELQSARISVAAAFPSLEHEQGSLYLAQDADDLLLGALHCILYQARNCVAGVFGDKAEAGTGV